MVEGFDPLPSVESAVAYTLGPVNFDPDEDKSHEWAVRSAVEGHLDSVVDAEGGGSGGS